MLISEKSKDLIDMKHILIFLFDKISLVRILLIFINSYERNGGNK